MDFSNTCTIGLGSNCEEREQQINQAIEHLSSYLSKCSVSSIYETEAINGTDAPYMNAVIHGVSPVLAGLGERGKHVAIIGATSYAWITAYYGTVSSGSVAVPLDANLPVEDLCELIDRADVTTFLK